MALHNDLQVLVVVVHVIVYLLYLFTLPQSVCPRSRIRRLRPLGSVLSVGPYTFSGPLYIFKCFRNRPIPLTGIYQYEFKIGIRFDERTVRYRKTLLVDKLISDHDIFIRFQIRRFRKITKISSLQ